MCFDNSNVCDVWDVQVVRARKPHHCNDCTAGILSGEYYKRIDCLFEGEWDTMRLCARCVWGHARVYDYEIGQGCKPYESHCPVGFLWDHMSELAENVLWGRSDCGENELDDLSTGWEASPITYREPLLAPPPFRL